MFSIAAASKKLIALNQESLELYYTYATDFFTESNIFLTSSFADC